MNESATIGGGLRERKRAATRAAITAVARSLTSERGLNGYTVEDVCEQAGISRRTFFNYFPTKEDAILGHVDDEMPEDVFEEFLRGGTAFADGRALRQPAPGPPAAVAQPVRADEQLRGGDPRS